MKQNQDYFKIRLHGSFVNVQLSGILVRQLHGTIHGREHNFQEMPNELLAQPTDECLLNANYFVQNLPTEVQRRAAGQKTDSPWRCSAL